MLKSKLCSRSEFHAQFLYLILTACAQLNCEYNSKQVSKIVFGFMVAGPQCWSETHFFINQSEYIGGCVSWVSLSCGNASYKNVMFMLSLSETVLKHASFSMLKHRAHSEDWDAFNWEKSPGWTQLTVLEREDAGGSLWHKWNSWKTFW